MITIKNKIELRIKFSMSKIAIFLILLYSFTVPLASYIYPATVLKYLTLLVAAVLFCIVMKKRMILGDVQITPMEIMMFFLGFFVTIRNYELKIGGYYYIISYWVLWIIAISSKYSGSWQKTALNLSCIFTMIYALATIVCYFSRGIYMNYVLPLFSSSGTTQMVNWYNQGYMLGITNHYSTNGMYLAIGVGAYFSKLLSDLKNKRLWIGFLILLVALMLTGKRGPLLFAICSIIVVIYFYKSDKPNGRMLKIFAIIFVGILAALIASIWVPQIMNVVQRFIDQSEDGDVSAGRGPLYALAIQLFQEKPLFGWGWGSYPYIYYEHLGKYEYSFQQRHAHNIYLQLLCEVGIVGFILFFVFFVWQICKALKLYRDYRKGRIQLPSSAKEVLPFAVFCQVFFLMYGMTGNPLYDVIVLFPYLLGCIIVNCYSYKKFSISNLVIERLRQIAS